MPVAQLHFGLVGLSHKTAPLDVRELAYIPDTGVGECLQRLADRDLLEAGVLLSTCNRTELYAVSASDTTDDRLLRAFGEWPHQLPYDVWRRHAYQLGGAQALEHLFRVAAGLDSMVIGEAQVLGQLKLALDQAQKAGTLDATLHVIVRGAIRAGKRVRNETELGRNAVSVSHVAVMQAREILTTLAGRGVLLVGAGAMSEIALRLFRNQGIGPAYLASRSRERAAAFGRPLGVASVDFLEIESVIGGIDVILSSSSAPYPLFDPPRIERFQALREERPLVIVDIAVPRDVHPDVARIPGVSLWNIDDLRIVAERNLREREAAAPEAERIVDEELARTRSSLQAREAAPLIRALVRRAERIRDGEVDRVLSQLPTADAATREALHGLADGLTAKLLDSPIRHLRETPTLSVDGAVLQDAFDLTDGE
jgi:glutamyl-tRNA reductase